MISVEIVKKIYMRCQSCYTDETILDISIGLQEGQMSTVRLCHNCVEEMYEKSKTKFNGN